MDLIEPESTTSLIHLSCIFGYFFGCDHPIKTDSFLKVDHFLPKKTTCRD